jgi:hypothetical protein
MNIETDAVFDDLMTPFLVVKYSRYSSYAPRGTGTGLPAGINPVHPGGPAILTKADGCGSCPKRGEEGQAYGERQA